MRNRPYGFEIYLLNVKTMRTIVQIFVAFSENLNFMKAYTYTQGLIRQYQISFKIKILREK